MIKDAVLDGCRTEGYKWDWDLGLGLEISGRGYAKSTFGANNRGLAPLKTFLTPVNPKSYQ